MEDDNVAIRLKGFIDRMGLTNSQFADTCGIPRPSLSQLLSGRNKKISDVLIGQIHQAYPDLSVLWLLFGEGEMLSSTGDKTESEASSAADAHPEQSEIGHTGIFGSNLFDEDVKNPDNGIERRKYQNIEALNKHENTPKTSIKQVVDSDLRAVELLQQIEKMKKNPRKVSQITIYYDDSTFETFYPKR